MDDQADLPRDVIFISHANPEDNRFAVWLAHSLVQAGYKVWCDETQLLCGDDMWGEIEPIIRHRAAKFVFVGSRSSNAKQGVRKEIHVATIVERTQKLDDFILPIVLDDLPFSDLNIEVTRLLAANFYRDGWAKGLGQLLARLERDGVPKAGPGPAGIASWWKKQSAAHTSVTRNPQICWTNWHPLSALPEKLALAHPIQPNKLKYLGDEYRYPVARFGETGVAALSPNLNPPLSKYGLVTLLGEGDENGIKRDQIRRMAVELIRSSWEHLCRSRGLHSHKLSNKRVCFYVKQGQIPGDEISFVDAEGRRRVRSVIGYKTVRLKEVETRRYWHLAIEGKPLLRPVPLIAIKLHILFSDDGATIWDSDKRLHRARRSQGASWWNPEWRDRSRGFMAWLAAGLPEAQLPIGEGEAMGLAAAPMSLESPVSYADPNVEAPEVPYESDASDEADDGEDVA